MADALTPWMRTYSIDSFVVAEFLITDGAGAFLLKFNYGFTFLDVGFVQFIGKWKGRNAMASCGVSVPRVWTARLLW